MEPDLTDEDLRETAQRKKEEIRQEEEGWTPKKGEREVLRPSREKEEYEEWKREREKARQYAKRRKAREEKERRRRAPGKVRHRNGHKAKKREYLFDIIPRWIKYSGLPKELYKKCGGQAWPILSCLISLDCRFNPDDPDWFDQSYREIAELIGIQDLKTIRRYVNKLEKAGKISVIRGEFKGLKSSFKISDPLPTPKDPNSIKAVNGGFLGRRGKEPNLRYYQRGAP